MADTKIQPAECIYRPRKTMLLNNFLGGIAWGVGSTLGLAIILTILGFILKQIHLIPFIGDFVTEITKYVNLHK